ncbi:MAG TPA: hypothetical protein VKK79_14820 [Candidatus Lokiarchaeia archaeon]|nr:hypothetical protein [Candidatus Lokiarchaeia archaeon]
MAPQNLPPNPDVLRLKELLNEKGEVVTEPKNGSAAVIVKDQKVARGSNNVEIAVGKVMSYPKYFDVVGYEKKAEQFPFSEGSVRTLVGDLRAPKEGVEIIVATFPITFMRTVDEHRWEDKLRDLPDLIDLLESM